MTQNKKLAPLPPMPRRRRAWGHIGVGCWAPPRKTDKVAPGTAVVGVCAKCRRIVRADALELRLPPFQTAGNELWMCKGGCE